MNEDVVDQEEVAPVGDATLSSMYFEIIQYLLFFLSGLPVPGSLLLCLFISF